MNLSRDAADLLAGALAVIALLGAACSPGVPPPDRVAEIDGRALSYVEFEEFLLHNSVAGTGVLASDVLSSLFDQFLDERLLACFAVDQLGLDEEIDSVSAAAALLEAQAEGVDETAVATYYRQNEAQFDLPERVHLRQLLFADQQTAERARDLWSAGTPYKSVVEGLVDAATVHVGEEGEFSRQQLPPVFADVLFALDDGEVSPVMPVDYGFHLFQVVRHLAAGAAPLATVAEDIRQDLVTRQREEFLLLLAAEARERYNVRVFERNLPFNYRGKYESNGSHENP